jgi:RimJ/RimL family protein N-acetyltransferase
MIIKKYGIELHRLTHNEIELVRQMRNKDSIRSKMFYQDIITKEMQETWFKSIDNIYNYFFVIIFEGEKIGLINGKNVDFEKKTCEGGIFIWDERYWFSGIPVRASICMMELTFNFALLNSVYAHIRDNNPIAIYYNKLLGFRPIPNQEKNIYELSKEDFETKSTKFKNPIMKLTQSSPLSIENIEFTDVYKKEHLYKDLPDDVRKQFVNKLPY